MKWALYRAAMEHECTVVVELLKRGLSAYLIADVTTTISTSPGIHFWLEVEILGAAGVDVITGKTVSIETVPGVTSTDTKRREQREVQKLSLSRGQLWQISNKLAWTDGEPDEQVARRYGIDPKVLPEIMGRCLYHWDGRVWRSIGPVWEE